MRGLLRDVRQFVDLEGARDRDLAPENLAHEGGHLGGSRWPRVPISLGRDDAAGLIDDTESGVPRPRDHRAQVLGGSPPGQRRPGAQRRPRRPRSPRSAAARRGGSSSARKPGCAGGSRPTAASPGGQRRRHPGSSGAGSSRERRSERCTAQLLQIAMATSRPAKMPTKIQRRRNELATRVRWPTTLGLVLLGMVRRG